MAQRQCGRWFGENWRREIRRKSSVLQQQWRVFMIQKHTQWTLIREQDGWNQTTSLVRSRLGMLIHLGSCHQKIYWLYDQQCKKKKKISLFLFLIPESTCIILLHKMLLSLSRLCSMFGFSFASLKTIVLPRPWFCSYKRKTKLAISLPLEVLITYFLLAFDAAVDKNWTQIRICAAYDTY